ncbi:MAG TPA: hypothetical protein VFL14_08745, partial [Xanthomonadales bacterium]|nr:hypothetical protein [Xanthomonadales bacterium]
MPEVAGGCRCWIVGGPSPSALDVEGLPPLVTLLAAVAFLLLAVRYEWLPARLLPHTVLNVDDPPGPFDRMKLARLEGADCFATLHAADVEFDRVPDRALV